MDVFYEKTFPVDFRDLDLFGHCRPSAMLGILQEAATQAGGAIHLSREEIMERYGAFWMLARIRYSLKRPVVWQDQVRVKTWHRGGKAAMMFREFDLYVGEELIGEALSAWVMADWNTRRIIHLSAIQDIEDTSGGSLCRSDTLRKLKLPDEMTLAESRKLGYSYTDVNAHVNNSRYADLLCDAVELDRRGRGKFVSSLQLGYLAECRAGETIDLFSARDGDAFYARGRGPEGKDRFEGILTLDNLS